MLAKASKIYYYVISKNNIRLFQGRKQKFVMPFTIRLSRQQWKHEARYSITGAAGV